LKNIDIIKKICQENDWDITIRPAISILSIGHYHTLLQHCLDNKLLIKPLWVDSPQYMDVKNLPKDIANQYVKVYEKFIKDNDLENIQHQLDYNENEYRTVIKKNIDSVLNKLKSEQYTDAETKLKELVHWCKRWDIIYKFDAKILYPEFKEIFEKYEY
jgi:hypothetical protein